MRLHQKIVLIGLAVTILFAGVIGVMLNIVINSSETELAVRDISSAMTGLGRDIQNSENLTLDTAKEISATKSVIAVGHLVSSYQTKDDYNRLLYDSEKSNIIDIFKPHLVSGIDVIALYDASGELIAFSSSGHHGLPNDGITSFPDQTPVLLDGTGQEQIELKSDLIPMQLAGSVMDEGDVDATNLEYQKHQDSVQQRIVVPVYRLAGKATQQQVAWLMVASDVENGLFNNHARANNLHFTGAFNSTQNSSPNNTANQGGDGVNLLLDPGLQITDSSISFKDDVISDQALVPLSNGEQFVVAMARNRGDISYLGEKLMQSGLIALGIFVLTIFFLGTSLLNRLISGPITSLADNVIAFKEGDASSFDFKYSRKDEIGTLSTSFADMANTIINRETELRQLNDSLEHLVSLRTEELAQANDDLEITLTELRSKQEEVLRSEKLSALGRMVAGFAHELNNPLMGLGAYIGVIQEGCPKSCQSEQILEAMEKAGKTVERLTKIVQNILHHTVVHEFQFTQFDVLPSIDETVHLFLAGATDHDLIVKMDIGDDLPPVWGDASSLKQVLLNILINARDAVIDSKEKRIDITASADAAHVSIKITDTGPGIPDEIMKKVFDPFFTSKAPGKGTGLGLSVSNDLMHNIKGSMHCCNGAKGGAEFVVKVPIYREEVSGP